MDIRASVLIGQDQPGIDFLATGLLAVFMATTVMRVDAPKHWCHLATYRRPRLFTES